MSRVRERPSDLRRAALEVAGWPRPSLPAASGFAASIGTVLLSASVLVAAEGCAPATVWRGVGVGSVVLCIPGAAGPCCRDAADLSAADCAGPSPVTVEIAASAVGCRLPGAGWTRVALGRDFGCVSDASRVACWGNNASGQLGAGSGDVVTGLAEVTSEGSLTSVSAAAQTACAIDADGHVLCWGAGAHGLLGMPTASSWAAPTLPASRGRLLADGVAVSSFSACAWRTDQIACWGVLRGSSARVDALASYAPVEARFPSPVREVVMSDQLACAWLLSGDVRCWARAPELAGGWRVDGGLGHTRVMRSDVRPCVSGDRVCGGDAASWVCIGLDGTRADASADGPAEATVEHARGDDLACPAPLRDSLSGAPSSAVATAGDGWCRLSGSGEVECAGSPCAWAGIGPTEVMGSERRTDRR